MKECHNIMLGGLDSKSDGKQAKSKVSFYVALSVLQSEGAA